MSRRGGVETEQVCVCLACSLGGRFFSSLELVFFSDFRVRVVVEVRVRWLGWSTRFLGFWFRLRSSREITREKIILSRAYFRSSTAVDGRYVQFCVTRKNHIGSTSRVRGDFQGGSQTFLWWLFRGVPFSGDGVFPIHIAVMGSVSSGDDASSPGGPAQRSRTGGSNAADFARAVVSWHSRFSTASGSRRALKIPSVAACPRRRSLCGAGAHHQGPSMSEATSNRIRLSRAVVTSHRNFKFRRRKRTFLWRGLVPIVGLGFLAAISPHEEFEYTTFEEYVKPPRSNDFYIAGGTQPPDVNPGFFSTEFVEYCDLDKPYTRRRSVEQFDVNDLGIM